MHGYGPATVQDPEILVERSLPLWRSAAVDADRFDLALALPMPDATGTEAVLGRAQMLLLAGRAREATGLLAAQHRLDLPAVTEAAPPDLLVAACRAATGDHTAYRWLLSVASTRPPPVGLLYLLGSAAEQCGDHRTADQAWTTLVRDAGVVTGFTLARYLSGVLARREPDDAADTLLQVVQAFVAHDDDLERHPGPILMAVECLRRRGDGAGADLLLHAAALRLPRAGLPAAGDHPGMRRFRRREAWLRWVHLPVLAPVVALVTWLDVPLLVVGGLLPVLLAHRLLRPAVPGLTPADGAAWRAARQFRQTPDLRLTPREQRNGVISVATLFLLFTVLVAGIAARDVVGTPAALAHTPGHALATAMIFVLAGAVLTAAGLGVGRLARHLVWRDVRRRSARRPGHHDCRCWQLYALTGSRAGDYLARHLHPVPPPVRFAGLSVARCPVTGTLWLSAAGPEPVLLRGATPAGADPELPLPATGGYL